jgi:MFS superfamily sulfate permease-like transporter
MEKVKQFVNEHPQWTSWIVLAIGMVAILVWSARDVGLLPGQWVALIVATILVAGLAVWIIGWEDEEEIETPAEAQPPTAEATAATEASETS